jgi:hypothetical protein
VQGDGPPSQIGHRVELLNGLIVQQSVLEAATIVWEEGSQPEPERTGWAAGISTRCHQ